MSSVSSICQKDDWEVTWLQPRTTSFQNKGQSIWEVIQTKQNSKIQLGWQRKTRAARPLVFYPRRKELSLQPRRLKTNCRHCVWAMLLPGAAGLWPRAAGSWQMLRSDGWWVMGDGWQALSAVHTPRASAIPALLEVLAQDPETIWVVLGNVTTAGAVACAKSSHSSLNCLEGCSKW